MEKREEHLEKLGVAFLSCVSRKDDGEYGSIGLDCKRPFGNSDVDGDILDIIGVEMEGDDGEDPCWSSTQREYAAELYDEIPNFLRRKYLKEVPKKFQWRFEVRK